MNGADLAKHAMGRVILSVKTRPLAVAETVESRFRYMTSCFEAVDFLALCEEEKEYLIEAIMGGVCAHRDFSTVEKADVYYVTKLQSWLYKNEATGGDAGKIDLADLDAFMEAIDAHLGIGEST